MGRSENRRWNDLLTHTTDIRRPVVVDQIFDPVPTLSYFDGRLAGVLSPEPKNTVKIREEGGESIVEHVEVEGNPTTTSMGPGEEMDTSITNVTTAGRYSWKYYGGTYGITGPDLRNNQGKHAVMKIVKTRERNIIKQLQKDLATDIYGDGTDNDNKALTGLLAHISTTATTADFDPSIYPWWVARVRNNAGSFAQNGLKYMENMWNTIAQGGTDTADAIFTDQTVFEAFKATMTPQQRLVNTNAAKAGFTTISYNDVPVFWDPFATAGAMFFLNSNHIKWRVHKDADMAMTPFTSPDNKDVHTAKLLWQGNITVDRRKSNGAIFDFT